MGKISEYRATFLTNISISYYDGKPQLGMDLRTYQKNGKTKVKIHLNEYDIRELKKELDICINGLEGK